jgi:hypothetical protein
MSHVLQTKLKQRVNRTYTIGVRFEGTKRKERRKKELRANKIIKELQQTIREKITPTKMDETLALVRQEKNLSGTKGAAKLAAHFEDRSNLGQTAYLAMLAAANGTLDRERKIRHFCLLLEEKPVAAIEWLVFGRTPYLEWLLQHRLQVAYDYSRNLIHSARRTLDSFLPPEDRLTSPLPEVSKEALLIAIDRFTHSNKETFSIKKNPSTRQKSFVQKLNVIHNHRQLIAKAFHQWLVEWNTLITNQLSVNSSSVSVSSSPSRWRQFKQFVCKMEEDMGLLTQNEIKKYCYLSVLRGCLISALLPYYNRGETVKKLIETRIICPEHLIAKPFRKNSYQKSKLIPLSLLMGSKYVVGRPGSSMVMTELGKKEGGFTIRIWPPRLKKERLVAQLRFHSRLTEMFANGARLVLLIIRSTSGPSGKLLVDLVLEGQYWMFLSQRRLKNSPLSIKVSSEPMKGVGLDINRIGPDMLAFSEQVTLPADMIAAMHHYIQLEPVLKTLHRKLSILEKTRSFTTQYSQLKQQMTFVYTRRTRLRKALHLLSCTVTTQVLLQTKSPILCVEDLKLTARGTKGALAKAILNMPDDIDIYERALLLIYYFTGTVTTLTRVNPRNTSRGVHVGCSSIPNGRLLRSGNNYDIAPCSACGLYVNTHINTAYLIRNKGLKTVSSANPSPSLSALPAIVSSSSCEKI